MAEGCCGFDYSMVCLGRCTFVIQAISYANERLDQDLSRVHMAGGEGLSGVTFSRLFRPHRE